MPKQTPQNNLNTPHSNNPSQSQTIRSQSQPQRTQAHSPKLHSKPFTKSNPTHPTTKHKQIKPVHLQYNTNHQPIKQKPNLPKQNHRNQKPQLKPNLPRNQILKSICNTTPTKLSSITTPPQTQNYQIQNRTPTT